MSTDTANPSERVRAYLSELRLLLARLSGTTMRNLPGDNQDLPEFGREVASTISLLTMYNERLLRRLVESSIGMTRPDPVWFEETVKWADLPKRQPSRRATERRLREVFERLRLAIVPLDESTLRQLPPQSERVLEFLTLSMMVQSHLAWYLGVEWFQRAFPDESLQDGATLPPKPFIL